MDLYGNTMKGRGGRGLEREARLPGTAIVAGTVCQLFASGSISREQKPYIHPRMSRTFILISGMIGPPKKTGVLQKDVQTCTRNYKPLEWTGSEMRHEVKSIKS